MTVKIVSFILQHTLKEETKIMRTRRAFDENCIGDMAPVLDIKRQYVSLAFLPCHHAYTPPTGNCVRRTTSCPRFWDFFMKRSVFLTTQCNVMVWICLKKYFILLVDMDGDRLWVKLVLSLNTRRGCRRCNRYIDRAYIFNENTVKQDLSTLICLQKAD